jgi:GT2 family glycosyltransferase/glycosyltransferase involved in cell wall biosynthesis
MTQDSKGSRPVQLHVIHDLGGGGFKWLRDFVGADSERVNLVLRSFTHDRSAGNGIALFASDDDAQPLAAWTFRAPIVATAVTHPEYRAALEQILRERQVDVVVVSSLIGHSLEVLDTGLATLVVNHDYYPYCPAINIHFDGLCESCDDRRIALCHAGNPRFNPFVDFQPPERIAVRRRFVEAVGRPNVTMVVPSRSVQENLTRLEPAFGRSHFVTIPHGYGGRLVPRPAPERAGGDRLVIMVFGQVSEAKGLGLLQAALPRLTRFAEVFLVGAREVGELFQFMPHVHVVSNYDFDELPAHVANINPHVAVLTSVVPETFSYALSELWMLGVPVAATRVGAFAERIREGETGLLFEPNANALVATLEALDADREPLARIRRRLAGWQPGSAEEMVRQYHRAAPVAAARAQVPEAIRATPAPANPTSEAALATQAMAMAGMWKQVRSNHLQMSLINEARLRTEGALQAAAAHYSHERARLEQGMAKLEQQIARRDAALVDQERAIAQREEVIAERDKLIAQLASEVEHRGAALDIRTAQLEEVFASTSWRLSSPVRLVGRAARQARTAARLLAWAFTHPSELGRTGRKVHEAWRRAGWLEAKKALLGVRREDTQVRRGDLWSEYRAAFERNVRPRVVEAIGAMAVRPLISVIVPTYNTREDVLVQMLESVRGQLYSDWELCVADDASTLPHVRRILEKYARNDGRINLHFGKENRGVAHASNRALEMVTGDWVVLLDHDDLLEEHALFRVAQAGIEDDADFIYSDEVLTTPDGATARRYVYRPAFSLEYLRSHPYIVHLVAFRTHLLREIGGFDETLGISQDYDLTLRAAERARTIVHVPDILYRWRIHGGSAGMDRKKQVMDASRGILQHHLERSKAEGRMEDGESFNLFEARYPLQPGLKVAIIIPTKNHGELLRQCIDSLRSTIKSADYDIVVVDHESDDAATREYLASLAESVRILRYEGAFNFSAINNFAVANLGEGHTHYLFCNNDIEAIEPGWLERMLELGQQASIGIVGAMLFYPDRKHLQHAGVCVGMYGAAEHYGKWVRFPDDPIEPELMRVNREVSAVTAACMLIRADAFREVKGFDEAIAVGFGDVDLCLRVGAKGFRVIISPHARLVHHESYTRGTSRVDPHPKDSALFRLKWREMLRTGDPYYNPGYSNEHTHWPVKQPLNVTFDIHRRVAKRDPDTGRTRMTFSPPA